MNDIPEEQKQHPDEVIETIHTIKATLDTVDKSLATISAFGKRTRQITISLILSLALDVALTIVVGILSANASSQSASAQMLAEQIKIVQHNTCVTSNEARRENVQLWDFFLSLVSNPSGSAKQRETQAKDISELHSEINKTFAQRPCP